MFQAYYKIMEWLFLKKFLLVVFPRSLVYIKTFLSGSYYSALLESVFGIEKTCTWTIAVFKNVVLKSRLYLPIFYYYFNGMALFN